MEDSRLEIDLKYAVINGDVVKAKRLIKGGVDVNYNRHLLQEAVVTGKIEIVKLLIFAGADINSISMKGETALHMACRRKRFDVASFLLEHGAEVDANIISTPSQYLSTPLQISLWQNDSECANLLIDNAADVNIPDRDGWSSLHWACRSTCSTDVLQKILDRGAKVNLKTIRHITPLCVAVSHKNVRAVQMLLENGADWSIERNNLIVSVYKNAETSEKNAQQILNMLERCEYFMRKTISGKTAPHEAKNLGIFISSFSKHGNHCERYTISISSVKKLSWLCRETVRKHLSSVHEDTAIKRFTQLLPLPEAIKDYLNLREELSLEFNEDSGDN